MSLAIQSARAQGDPGLFGFLGKAVGTVAKVATSFMPGPAGAVARFAAGKIFGGAGAQPTARALPAVRTLPPVFTNMEIPTQPRTISAAQQIAASGPSLGFQGAQIQMPTGTVGVDATPAIGCPQGYKPNKSGYYRRIRSPGNPEGGVFYIEPGSRCVKIRRRNAANPRAADRAVSRIQSAKRFATKMNRITVRKKCD